MPFFAHIQRRRGFWPTDVDNPVSLADRVYDLQMEGEDKTAEIVLIEPGVETGGGQVGVQATDEWLVIAAGIREEYASHQSPL